MITISARMQYGCLAVLELAKRAGTAKPTRIDQIASEQQIPKQFLVHILLQLKRKGILNSVRGVGGGYSLARSPSLITVGQVVRALEVTLTGPGTRTRQRGNLGRGDSALFSLWNVVEKRALGVVDSVTFEQLLREIGEPSQDVT